MCKIALRIAAILVAHFNATHNVKELQTPIVSY